MKRLWRAHSGMVCMHTNYFCAHMEMKDPIETRQAWITRTAGDLVEVRFKPEATLEAEGLGEAIMAKRELCGADGVNVLMILPADMEVDIRAVTADPQAVIGPCKSSMRTAVVAGGGLNPKLVAIHLRYHMYDHPTEVFTEEADARAWLSREAPKPSLS